MMWTWSSEYCFSLALCRRFEETAHCYPARLAFRFGAAAAASVRGLGFRVIAATARPGASQTSVPHACSWKVVVTNHSRSSADRWFAVPELESLPVLSHAEWADYRLGACLRSPGRSSLATLASLL